LAGANGDWYFFRVADLSQFLENEWGSPDAYDPNDWKNKLAGQTGVIRYQIQWADATGHLSLWNGATNVDGPSYDYSNPATRGNAPFNGMQFWPLK
jgi:hypothetical protein